MYTREMAWHSNELGKVHSRPGGSASPLALEVGIPHQPQTSLLYASMISPIEGPRINPVQSAFDLAIGMYGGAAGTRMIGGTSFGACVTEFAQSIRSGPATVSSVISGTNSDSVTLCSSLYSSISNSQLFNNSNGLSWLTNGHHLFNSFSTVGVDGTVVFEQKVSAASRKTDLIAQIVSYLKEWNTKFEIDFSSLNIDISPIPQKLYVTDLYLSNAPAYLDLDIRSTIALDDLERLWTDVFTDFSTSSIKTVNTHAFLIKFTNEVLALFSASITVCACINFEFVATREPSRFDEVRNFLVRSSISPPVNSLSDLSNWSSLVTGQKGERTERLFRTGEDPSLPRDVLEKTLQRLDWLDAGLRLHDIATLNGLRFHKYAEADQTDTYVIHVKDTWWIRFRWVHPNCCEVSLFRKR